LTRNALLFDKWRIKLSDFANLDLVDDYPCDWYRCKVCYCPPRSNRPYCHNISTINRKIFALSTAIYEIVKWKVLYSSETEVLDNEVTAALINCKWP
jgi:hypothetical protein